MADQTNPNDQNTSEEGVQKEKRRARWLLFWFGGGLVFLVIIYLGLHLFSQAFCTPWLCETKARCEALRAVAQASVVLDDTMIVVKPSVARARLRPFIAETAKLRRNGTQIAAIDSVLRAFKQSTQKSGKAAGDDTLIVVNPSAVRTLLRSFIPADTAKKPPGVTKATAMDSAVNVLIGLTNEEKKARLDTLLPKLKIAVRQFWADSAMTISKTLDGIEKAMEKDKFDQATLRRLFAEIKEEAGQEDGRFFWSNKAGRLMELVFWSWFGTLLYLLMEIYKHYPPAKSDLLSFIAYTPWYFITAIKGPFVALFVLFGLTSVNIQISTITVALDQARIELLLFVAAVLGFYNRVAQAQLEILVEKIFPEAWKRAQGSPMTIQPPITSLELGKTQQFSVIPNQEVEWKIDPHGCGEITTQGVYTAPNDETKADQSVTIKASSKTDTTRVADLKITIKKKSP